MSLVTSLRHYFVPHESNNHRAKGLHIDSLFVYVLLFALLNLGVKFLHRTIPDVLGYATDIHVEQLLAGTNAQRASAGLGALTLNGQLSAAAAGKAADMLAKNYWAHNSPTGATPWDFIAGSGYRYTVAGENLAKNFSDSGAVMNAWMASPTHRANIVKGSYKEVGFAVVNGKLNGEDTTLVVQMFGAQSSPIAAKPTAAQAPVVISVEAASAKVIAAEPEPPPDLGGLTQPEFQSVTKEPIINIPTVSRDIVFAFIGIMMGLLFVDMLIARRRHVVRIAGHNIAHMLFLIVIYILASSIGRGRLL